MIQHNPFDADLAAQSWELGVFNPLADTEPERTLSFEEDNWLFLANAAGFFTLDVIDAVEQVLYWTAPPPDYDPQQADWYIRPDLTQFLEAPLPLQVAIEQYPVTLELLQSVLKQWAKRLGWSEAQLSNFIQKEAPKTIAPLQPLDLAIVITELKLKVHNLEQW